MSRDPTAAEVRGPAGRLEEDGQGAAESALNETLKTMGEEEMRRRRR